MKGILTVLGIMLVFWALLAWLAVILGSGWFLSLAMLLLYSTGLLFAGALVIEAGVRRMCRQQQAGSLPPAAGLKRPQAAPAKHGAEDTGVSLFTADDLRELERIEHMRAGGADGGEQP